MKNSTKGILFGIGATLAIGAVYLWKSEEALQKIEARINRQRAKHFVNDKLKGNDNALKVVENLSDEEVANLLSVVDKVTDLKGQVSEYGENLKDATTEFKELFLDKKDDVLDKADDLKKKIKK